MAKKTEKNEENEEITQETTYRMDNFNSDVCRLKHLSIDKEFKNIKEESNTKHYEIKSMIEELHASIKEDINNSHRNLKDKIILTEKTIGEKIDKLNDFDDTLKGNGKPGVWESIRSLQYSLKVIIIILTTIIVLDFGGSFKGVTWNTIRAKLGMEKLKTEEVSIIDKTRFNSEIDIEIVPSEQTEEKQKDIDEESKE